MPKHPKSCLLKLLVMIGAVLIVCFVTEASLRLLARSRWTPFVVAPDELKGNNEPGLNLPNVMSKDGGVYWEPYISIPDDPGMRKKFLIDYYNRHFYKELLRNQKRIIILGDSVGYGLHGKQNIPKNFSMLLEVYLNKRRVRGLTFAVANFSCGSYSTFQEAIAFRRHGLAFSPHLVILQFTENDFTNFVYSDEHPRYTTRAGTQNLTVGKHIIPLSLPLPRKLNETLSRYSMFFQFLNMRVDALRAKRVLQRESGEHRKNRELALNSLDRINKTAQKNGSKFLVVLFPVTDKPFSQHSSEEFPYNEVVAFAAKHNIPVFDLIAAMRDVDYKAVRLDPGGHFNEVGHRVVAEKLFSYLKNHPELLNSKPKPVSIGSYE
ncbi:MAG: SGNH/GDSL hydrolase family protein [bacterium]